MAIQDQLTFNNVISFDVYPASIVGSQFKDVKILALLDADTARNWIDPEAMHANVYPTLPDGVPDDATQYQYVKFQYPNGKIGVLGVPWIKADTVTVSSRGTLTITVSDAGPKDREAIVKALAANGYRTASVKLQ